MASRKGIIVTGIILAAITAASFLFWMIPQENEATFSISDYQNYLDGVKNIHNVLEDNVELEFQNLLDGKISSEEYITIAETTSSQITEQITELVKSKPSEEWQESYINYMESLRKFNSQVRETIVLAEMINEEDYNIEMYEKTLEDIEKMKSESVELINLSEQARP